MGGASGETLLEAGNVMNKRTPCCLVNTPVLWDNIDLRECAFAHFSTLLLFVQEAAKLQYSTGKIAAGGGEGELATVHTTAAHHDGGEATEQA